MENENPKPDIANPETSQPTNLSSRLKTNKQALEYIGAALLSIIIIFGIYYWQTINNRIYSDKAEIFAPLIITSPSQPSILQNILVKNGDYVSANQVLARFNNNQLVRSKIDGLVVDTNNQIGKLFSPGMAVVTMINPDDLRLIVHVPEDKGLNSIRPGQKVNFTVDAFGNKTFYGVVEEISQTADQSSVVFSISDKREEKDFSVKIKYENYPELLNGMSAKAWIFK